MSLTPSQLTALKNDIDADPSLSGLANTPDNNQAIATVYNAEASPSFYVYRTRVSESEYTDSSGVDVANGNATTNWSWTAFINRSVGEREAWSRMFQRGFINPSAANVRQAFTDIFSGAGGAAQRNHLAVVSLRKATRAEKLFATGAGSFASPAAMTFEGSLTYQDVNQARSA